SAPTGPRSLPDRLGLAGGRGAAGARRRGLEAERGGPLGAELRLLPPARDSGAPAGGPARPGAGQFHQRGPGHGGDASSARDRPAAGARGARHGVPTAFHRLSAPSRGGGGPRGGRTVDAALSGSGAVPRVDGTIRARGHGGTPPRGTGKGTSRMRRLRFLTAGESHGPALLGILEGLPAGLRLEASLIDRELSRRQLGYGRGGRMKIESDRVRILAGVRHGRTLGSPLGLLIENLDHVNWRERMQVEPGGPDPEPVRVPRPGHADLAGGLKYGHTDDLRNVLERASARETAMRVALGAAAKALLREFGIGVGSYVMAIGSARGTRACDAEPVLAQTDAEGLARLADGFRTRALDEASDERMARAIDEAMRRRETLGGVIEVVVTGLFPGL